ncbi:MAG TPA: ABC transporter permease [Chitinophagaceae bacterium]
MIRNLQIEWMKIKNYRVFQVFSILYMLGIVIIIYMFYRIYTQLTSRLTGGDAADIFKLFSEDNIWTTVCFSTSFLLYLPGMIIITLFINEVNYKTHRQNIIDGWKRETFIYTKIGLILCVAIAVTLMNIIATLLMCAIVGTEFSILSGLDMLGYTFILTFVYMMFALLLATLFRRSGVAVIVFLVYGLLIEFLLMLLFWYLLPGTQHFLPLQVADSLITPDFQEGPFSKPPVKAVLITAAIAYASLYVYLTVRKYKYDDL